MKITAMSIAIIAIILFPTFIASLLVAVTTLSALGIAGAWVMDQNHRRREARSAGIFMKA